jgi:hypothetical protein
MPRKSSQKSLLGSFLPGQVRWRAENGLLGFRLSPEIVIVPFDPGSSGECRLRGMRSCPGK